MLLNYVMKTLIGIFTDSSHNIHKVYSESSETSKMQLWSFQTWTILTVSSILCVWMVSECVYGNKCSLGKCLFKTSQTSAVSTIGGGLL